jgi:hypothetical protein
MQNKYTSQSYHIRTIFVSYSKQKIFFHDAMERIKYEYGTTRKEEQIVLSWAVGLVDEQIFLALREVCSFSVS